MKIKGDLFVFEELNKKVFQKGYKGENFNHEVELAFGFSELPQNVRDKIHWLAWDRGHSAGYGEVFNQYFDLIDLTITILSNER